MCGMACGASDGVCVWYSVCQAWDGVCVGLGMGSVCGIACGAWGGIYMLYRAGNGCLPFSCVLQRAVLCSHKM